MNHTDADFDTVMPVFLIVQDSVALGCEVDRGDKMNWRTCTNSLVKSHSRDQFDVFHMDSKNGVRNADWWVWRWWNALSFHLPLVL